jgi:hypothetical protein
MLSRQHPRHPVQVPVTFTGDHDGQGLVTNLSLSGCRIERKDTHVERRAVLTLSLYPTPQESPVTIEVGMVRWTSGPAWGMEFLSLSFDAQQRLDRYIAGPARIQTWVKYLIET